MPLLWQSSDVCENKDIRVLTDEITEFCKKSIFLQFHFLESLLTTIVTKVCR